MIYSGVSQQTNKACTPCSNFTLAKVVFVLCILLSQATAGSKKKDPVLEPSELTQPIALGKALYQKNCKACHRYYYRFAAPDWHTVLNKYEQKQDSLRYYIMDPYPINPEEYPEMDVPKLDSAQSVLVMKYLYTLREKALRE
jgi:mono/diheme cytochrome c family protein